MSELPKLDLTSGTWSLSSKINIPQTDSLISLLSDNEDENEDKVDSFNSCFKAAFHNIFSTKKKIDNIEQIDTDLIYFTNNSSKSISKKSTQTQITQVKRQLFKTEIKLIPKKRGRKLESNSLLNSNKTLKSHDKYTMDNILRKVQIHFVSFIIDFLNDILKELHFEESFLNIDHGFKRDISKKKLKELKTKKIFDIVCIDISTKYLTKDKSYNRNIYTKVKNKENKIINKLFDAYYFEIFDIYYKNQSKFIDLQKFGLEKEFKLSNKTETFIDLLKKYENEEKYVKNLKISISQNYLKKDL